MAKITSNAITFIDQTDSRKLEVYINSNLPTTQIFDVNNNGYTPDWSSTPLHLNIDAYLDSVKITDKEGLSVQWFIKQGVEAEVEYQTGKSITISGNQMSETINAITYICVATYQNVSTRAQITFLQTKTGLNGTHGTSAPIVKAQYSEDGTSGWNATLNSSTHKYIRFSYDNGATWTSAIKISGEDGKSVEIKGVAYAKTTPITGQTVALYSDANTATQITGATEGDSYLVDGYLCVHNGTNFVCTGQIQGPKGDKGDSYYLFIRYADNANGGGISTTPNGKTYIGFYRSSINQVPTDVSATIWNWNKFVGDNAKGINLTANAQVFKVDKSNAISPATITVTAQAVNTSVSAWTYSTDGGKTFTSTLPTGVAINGNVVTLTGTSIAANSIVIKASDGTYSDVLTVYKVIDGVDGLPGNEGAPASIAFLSNENMSFVANSNGQVSSTTVYCNVVAYNGTTKVTPELGTITGLPTGMSVTATNITTVSNEKVIPIVIANNATLGSANSISGSINIPITSPVATTLKLNWNKINTGSGIKSVTVTYGTSTSASTQPTSWQSSVPTVAEGSYLWTRTITDYTDDTIPDTVTYTYAKQGVKGDQGSPGSPVTVSKIEYQSGISATAEPTGSWSTNVVSVAEGSYLWTKTTFSDNNVAYGVARQGRDGAKGDDGKGVSSIVEQYYQSTSATTQSGGAWSTTVPTWADGKYIWTRSVITYTDSTTHTTSPVCVTGQKGGIGNTGVGVSSVDVWYYQSTSATALSGGSWSTTAPTWSDGKYVWTKTIITYTDNTTDETNAVCITGQKGSTGVGVKSVTEYYLATASNSGVTTSTSGWTTAIQTITVDKKYLWNYEVITYTDGNTSSTTPIIIGVFGNTGDTGATGKGIKSVTEYYLATSSSSGVTTSTTGWTTTMQTLTTTNKYLWNYELITYTDDSKTTISPVIIGVYGDKGNQGDDGVGIASTTITYGVSDASSTQPTSWQSTLPTVADGKYLWTRTVIDYTDTAKADTVSYTYAKQGTKGDQGSAGSSVTVTSIQYQEGTSATTAPTGTWSNSVVSVAEGRYLWTKTVFSDGKTAYGVAKQGSSGVSAVTFQIYATNGYLLTKDLSEITLQTFAYEGSTAITSGATYQWAQYIEDAWENISGATASSLVVTKDAVLKSKSYKCTMTYKSKQYTSTVTVQDKTDIHSSLIQTAAKYSSSNKFYWLLYAIIYSEEGERDKLLGPISVTSPNNPTSGQYWYKIDEANYTVALMKYSGTTWVETTDKQELVYDWSLINDNDIPTSLGSQSKVKIITSSDFSKTCSVQCNIRGAESVPLSYSNQILIDPSDPIVSSVEPTNPTPGQLWIKTGTNGLYTLLAWDASLEKWIVSETDSRVKVHISKPASYEVGDVWVVGSDYEPTIYINGVAQSTKHLVGTMLKAQYSSQSYKDSDWVEALNYKKEIDNLKDNLNTYNQFFSFDDDGLTMQAKNKSGVISEFKTKLTNTELGFYQGENKVAHINNNQLNISKAEITNGMTIKGSTPVLEIGNFIIMQESNGSLSIGLNS